LFFKKIINKVKEILENNKKIVQNLSYLSVLQIFNMLIPLLTYPYLIRVLGKETYGLVVFAQAIIGYLVILVSFGFNISATKQISENRDDRGKVNEIVSNIFILKGILFVMSVVLLIFIMSFYNNVGNYQILFYLTLYLCVYEWLFPIWYFQGLEEMKYITILNVISRSIFLILIFVLIKSEEDYLLYPLISGIGAIVASALALVIVFGSHGVKLQKTSIKRLKFYIQESIPIFISNISIKLYVNSNKIIIGSFLGMDDVAYYDLGEKLVSLLKMPQGILSQVLFPKISKFKDIKFVRKIFKFSVFLNIGLYVLLLIAIKPLILFLGGHELLTAIPVVLILGLTIPLTAMSNVFGIQLLLPFGYNRAFSKIIVYSGFFYLSILFIMKIVFGFSIENISLTTVLTEVFVTIYMYNYCLKLNLWKKSTII
jgi:O-antigen/teichoic acid export membrane protein